MWDCDVESPMLHLLFLLLLLLFTFSDGSRNPPPGPVGVGAAELQRIGCSAARGEVLRASGVAAQLD